MGAPEGDDHPLRFEPHRVRALTHTADSTRPCTPDCTVNSISNVYVISVFDKNVNPGDPEATVSSASLRSPWGRRAIGRVGARRFDAAGVSNGPRRRARRLRLPRADAGPDAACAAGLRPPPIRPAASEASVGGVRGFR